MKTAANQLAEISFASSAKYPNPFMDVTLDVEFTVPDGGKKLVISCPPDRVELA